MYVTAAVCFSIPFVLVGLMWNFHSDVCDGSCSFLHTPCTGGGDVFKHQAPNNHHVHVHVPTPCIDLRFVCIVCPFALNKYCGIACEFLCLKQANYCLLLSPQQSLSQQFLSFCGIFPKGTTYFEWINDTHEFTVYDIGFA
jgi:hypothetical protein